jgi:hypothetical protein
VTAEVLRISREVLDTAEGRRDGRSIVAAGHRRNGQARSTALSVLYPSRSVQHFDNDRASGQVAPNM